MPMPCSLFIFRIAKFTIFFAFSFHTQIESWKKKWFITLFRVKYEKMSLFM